MACLLRLPAEWGGSVNCALGAFGVRKDNTNNARCPHCGDSGSALHNRFACGSCGRLRPSSMPSQSLLHPVLRLSVNCSIPQKPTPLWANIVAPYVNVSASDCQVSHVLADCAHKLNGLDPERGVGVIHGLLAAKDDVELCKKFLELGVDTETCFVCSAASSPDPLAENVRKDDMRRSTDEDGGRTPQHGIHRYLPNPLYGKGARDFAPIPWAPIPLAHDGGRSPICLHGVSAVVSLGSQVACSLCSQRMGDTRRSFGTSRLPTTVTIFADLAAKSATKPTPEARSAKSYQPLVRLPELEAEGLQKPESGRGSRKIEDIDHGTAVHFAAFFGRDGCLSALIDAGSDLTALTASGRTAWDVAKDASVKNLLDKAVSDGPISLAKLAKDGKYFALRHRMRAGKVTAADLKSTCDGKTAMEWIWAGMCEWNFAMKFDEDSLVPFKIMSEMKFRYGSDPLKFGNPPSLAHFVASGGNGASSGNADGFPEASIEKLLSNQTAILESLCVLSTEVREQKGTVQDDGRRGRRH